MAGEFVKVASAGDVAADKLKVVEVDDLRVCLVRSGAGVVALSATCTHAGCDLGEDGEVDGDEIECGCHGSRFKIASGEVTNGPARRPLQKYEVREEGGDVMVSAS